MSSKIYCAIVLFTFTLVSKLSDSTLDMSQIDQKRLRQLLVQYFELKDIRTMAFDLKFDYESLKGDTKDEKIVSLIQSFYRRGQSNELIEYCQSERPNADFQQVFISNERFGSKSTAVPENVRQDTDWVGFLLDYSLIHRKKDKVIYNICANCIGAFDLEPLLDALDNSEREIRKFAAKTLGEIGGRFAVNEIPIVSGLIKAINLDEQDVETKRRAVWALGAMRPSEAKARMATRKTLRTLLYSNYEDTSVRWKAAWALGEMQANEEAGILAHFARRSDVDMNIRRAAMRSLGVLKAVKYREMVESFANANGTKFERTAAWSLAEINGKIMRDNWEKAHSPG